MGVSAHGGMRFLVTIALAACVGGAASGQGRVLYAGGCLEGNRTTVPVIWEGMSLRVLPTGSHDSNGQVLALLGGNRLVAAGVTWIEKELPHPVEWEDGELKALPLPTGSRNAWTTGIAYQGNSIVISGYTLEAGQRHRPLYWKDGSLFLLPLSPGMNSGEAEGIYGSSGSTWIGGTQSSKDDLAGGYWKDGNWTVIQSDDVDVGSIWSVAGNAGTVLFGGDAMNEDGDNSATWFIGYSGPIEESILGSEDDGSANLLSVFVEGPNRWAAGTTIDDEGRDLPAIWRNGELQSLKMPASYDSGYAVCLGTEPDGTVAAGGYVRRDDSTSANYAVLWRDVEGEPTMLPTGSMPNAMVKALALAYPGLAGLSGKALMPSLPNRKVDEAVYGISIGNGEASFIADNRGLAKRDGVVLDGSIQPLADFDLECSLKLLGGPSNYGNGIICRVGPEGKGLLFNVTADGRVALYDYDSASDSYAPYTLVSGQVAPKIQIDAVNKNGLNSLKISARGSRIRLFVNGTQIAELGVDILGAGGFGVYVSAGDRVQFSDWTVTPRSPTR